MWCSVKCTIGQFPNNILSTPAYMSNSDTYYIVNLCSSKKYYNSYAMIFMYDCGWFLF